MKVYIVIEYGFEGFEIDKVFNNEASAIDYVMNKNSKKIKDFNENQLRVFLEDHILVEDVHN